jgi:hypothetical protein
MHGGQRRANGGLAAPDVNDLQIRAGRWPWLARPAAADRHPPGYRLCQADFEGVTLDQGVRGNVPELPMRGEQHLRPEHKPRGQISVALDTTTVPHLEPREVVVA